MPQVATVPTKRGGRRPAGILRRSFKFDKEANRSIIYVDFVWVFPEFRGCGLGRQLMGAGLVVGKPKDVRLQVAGSDENRAAVGLYTSLGFAWAKDAPERTEMVCSAELAADAARRIALQRGSGDIAQQTAAVLARLGVSHCGDVSVRLELSSCHGADATRPSTGPVAQPLKLATSGLQSDRAARLSAG